MNLVNGSTPIQFHILLGDIFHTMVSRTSIYPKLCINTVTSRNLTQVGLVLKLVNGSLSLQFHVLLNDIFHTVVSSTDIDPELYVRLFTPSN